MHSVGEAWVKNQMLRPDDWGKNKWFLWLLCLHWTVTPLFQHWVEDGTFWTQTEKFTLSNCRCPRFSPWGRSGLDTPVSYNLKNDKWFHTPIYQIVSSTSPRMRCSLPWMGLFLSIDYKSLDNSFRCGLSLAIYFSSILRFPYEIWYVNNGMRV